MSYCLAYEPRLPKFNTPITKGRKAPNVQKNFVCEAFIDTLSTSTSITELLSFKYNKYIYPEFSSWFFVWSQTMQLFDSGVTCATTLTWFATTSIVTANKLYYTMFRKQCYFEILCSIFSCSDDGNRSKSSQWWFFVLTLIKIRTFRKCQMHCVWKKATRTSNTS
jgi:hypothetical protein